MDDSVAETAVLEALNEVVDAAFETIKERKLKKVRRACLPRVGQGAGRGKVAEGGWGGRGGRQGDATGVMSGDWF